MIRKDCAGGLTAPAEKFLAYTLTVSSAVTAPVKTIPLTSAVVTCTASPARAPVYGGGQGCLRLRRDGAEVQRRGDVEALLPRQAGKTWLNQLPQPGRALPLSSARLSLIGGRLFISRAAPRQRLHW
jgi:hypothetical protein